MEEIKKVLTYNIERIGIVDQPTHAVLFDYIYKFTSTHILENIENLPKIYGVKDEDYFKEALIKTLTFEFNCALNTVVFGDPAGKK